MPPILAMRNSQSQRGVVAIVQRAGALLVIKRSQHVIAPGKFCFPGGGIHASETDEEALIREMREELGVESRPIRRIWQSVTPWSVQLGWWSTEVPVAAALVPNPLEVESVHWLDRVQLKAHPQLLESNAAFLEAWEAGAFDL